MTEKKAFLMVGIGTAYQEARQLAMTGIQNQIRADFPQYEIRQAFASQAVIEKLAKNDGIQVDNEKQALERLQREGFTEVIVQPYQIFASEEFEQVRTIVRDSSSVFVNTEILPCLTVWVKQEEHKIN